MTAQKPADYVLYDNTHKPLAVIEAKRTCVDVSKGRQQAKLYADLLEKQYKRRPCVFLTNGFETRIIDGQYPERKVACIYSKADLEKMFNLRRMRTSLDHINVDKKIAGRYYQEAAIKAVCDSFDKKNRRKALLVMATGSGSHDIYSHRSGSSRKSLYKIIMHNPGDKSYFPDFCRY